MAEATTSSEELRTLVEALPDDRVQEAIVLLKHLEDDEPLSAEELANLESGLEDARQGRMAPLEEYERQRVP